MPARPPWPWRQPEPRKATKTRSFRAPGQRSFWRVEKLTKCSRCLGKKKRRVYDWQTQTWKIIDPCDGCKGTGKMPIAQPPPKGQG